jgi:predicted aconitase with swiveling domain
MDPATGAVIERRHPQHGETMRARVVAMPGGRGSSSSSTVLAEAVRAGVAPEAIVLRRPDPILPLGALVAAELYGRSCPVVVLDDADYEALAGLARPDGPGPVVRVDAHDPDGPAHVEVGAARAP